MIKGTIVGDEQIVARFERIEGGALPKLKERISRIVVRLQRKVMTDKLSGQTLNVRTGTLRRSIHNEVTVANNGVTGIVGTNMEYAAVHEYGFHDTVNVKEHLRTIKKAWGKPLKEPKKITVRAHERQANFPERSFLRSALADMRQEIMVEITEGVGELLHE